MNRQNASVEDLDAEADLIRSLRRPAVVAVAAPPGAARRAYLGRLLDEAREAGQTTCLLSSDLSAAGIWAGLAELIRELLPDLKAERPDLVESHRYEITAILPELREELHVQYKPLTETVPADEKVRLYPMDRAFRILHGIIDVLIEWHGGGPPLVLACDHFDRAGRLVARFYRELVRRAGDELRLLLLLGAAPEAAQACLDGFAAGPERRRVGVETSADEAETSAEAGARAAELEKELGNDLVQLEIHLPRLIHLWSSSNCPERALRWKAMAFAIYNHYGFYEDALFYGEEILPHVDRVCREDPRFNRWQLIGGLHNSYIAVGQMQRAYEVMVDEALDRLEDHGELSRAYYIMAMLHARFLPERNLTAAERYLGMANEQLDLSTEPPEDRVFFSVFLANALAYVRHRQGRTREAIELCERGSDQLDQHLSPEHHRLHRSVLKYNIGQVYASVGDLHEAIRFYSATLEIDPNYSEYYNDRGSLYLKAGRPLEAERDFHRAIELSPPYPEVWTNLGQCFRQMSRLEEAVDSYSRALDLQPGQILALLGRARSLEALGRGEKALEDYAIALAIDPGLWDALADRAVLHYEAGDYAASLADLDRSIELAPRQPLLFKNRAHLLAELGESARAAMDLGRYLELAPDCEERAELEARKADLESAAGA